MNKYCFSNILINKVVFLRTINMYHKKCITKRIKLYNSIPDSHLSNCLHCKLIQLNNSNIREHLQRLQLCDLKHLWLHEMGLKRIPTLIYGFVHLETLDLSFNQIKRIPRKICHLVNLKVLKLNDNYIKKIPKELSQLVNLELLGLHNNKIKKIPYELHQLTNYKDLNHNQIKVIPEGINRSIISL